ncbi:MAG: hypothetical protein ACTSRI_16945 [Promethearchaeota archaeon]
MKKLYKKIIITSEVMRETVDKPSFRTSGGHRRYGKKRVLLFYKGKEENGREGP